MILPALLPLSVKAPLPESAPLSVSGAVVLPLFRRLNAKDCPAQEPFRITGVFAADPKLTVQVPVTFVQLLLSVIGAPPWASSGKKAVVLLTTIGPVPKELLLLKLTKTPLLLNKVPPL